MEARAGAGGGGGDYIASLLSSSPRLGFGVLGGMPVMDGAGGDGLEKFCGDPAFAERAARLSSFNGQRFTGGPGLFGMPPPAPTASNGGGGGCSREASSVSDPASAMKDANAKKRKAPAARGKGKEPSLSSSCQVAEQKESDAKRCKTEEGEKKESSVKPKTEQAGSDSSVEDRGQKQGKGKNAKPAEPPKDYVHVRARRGQATDSHSLAERVRRERISERMKLLQSLVPGCNKITGKALMLDEIINYVQSLQRQVEFLSMKLATMSPQLEPDGAHYLPASKDIMAVPAPAAAFSYAGGSPADAFAAHHGLEACGAGEAFGWEQDLQSMVHAAASSPLALPLPLPLPHPHGFYGQAATVNHMKVEP